MSGGVSPQWDPQKYLDFADERGRPFLDLIGRVRGTPHTIVDLGCGPGQLSRVLRARWPDAAILGIDSSPAMIGRAEAGNTDPNISYLLADAAEWEGSADLIVSNALFQWVPDQFEVITGLTAMAAQIAIQVPDNFDAPSHALMREVAARTPYAEHLEGFEFRTGNGAESYLGLFHDLGWEVDAWTTTYLHVLPGPDAVFEWISGTGARPVIQALPEDVRAEFVEDYKAALRVAYPRQEWGTVLPFERVFVVARRPGPV